MTRLLDREKLYLGLPTPLQNAIVSLEGGRLARRRYDSGYRKVFEQYRQRTYIRQMALAQFRTERLRSFLTAAGEVPFWKKRIEGAAVDLQAKDLLAEIQKLPILTKAEVKAHLAQIASTRLEEETITCHTSGTTGSGLVFPVTRGAEREQWAVWWRYRGWHGIDQETWCGYFGGRSIVPLDQKGPPFWRVNLPGRQFLLSAYHLREETAELYVNALAKRRLVWLHGYPSMLALLASYARDLKLRDLPPVRVITTGAESLLPHQRDLPRNTFHAKVFQHYGQAEGVANFSECEHGRLHVDEDFSLVELLPVPGSERTCHVVGTNWTNPAFPLLRYDTGDIVTLCEENCACGRSGRVVASVDGRKEDYLLLPNGARVGRLDHIFKDLVHIREAQVAQSEHATAVFRVVKGPGYDQANEETRLLAEARKRLGPDLQLRVEYTDRIPRTPSGKIRLVISETAEGRLEPSASKTEASSITASIGSSFLP